MVLLTKFGSPSIVGLWFQERLAIGFLEANVQQHVETQILGTTGKWTAKQSKHEQGQDSPIFLSAEIIPQSAKNVELTKSKYTGNCCM